jgi:hypothetical protein
LPAYRGIQASQWLLDSIAIPHLAWNYVEELAGLLQTKAAAAFAGTLNVIRSPLTSSVAVLGVVAKASVEPVMAASNTAQALHPVAANNLGS